jgi:AAA domain
MLAATIRMPASANSVWRSLCNFFLYSFGGNNWCLEGQNGSGKTSLVSAILWALTGKRIREHEGPVDERGEREDVESDDGTKVGNWPPLAAYPTTIADLGKQAEVLGAAHLQGGGRRHGDGLSPNG